MGISKKRQAAAVLILAAGRGTRMRSRLPKVLHAAGGRSMLAGVLAAARGAGVAAADIAVVAGYEAGRVAAAAAVAAKDARIMVQEPQLGTGHAVMIAQDWWRGYERLVVVHGDMPLLSAATVGGLLERQTARAAAAVLASAEPREPRAYGRILRDGERVIGIVEDKQASAVQKKIRELNAGFYCFDTRALAAALEQLGTDNPHREYYLTDTIALIASAGGLVLALPLGDERECLGVNDRAELAQLDSFLRRRKVEALLAAGVTIQSPDSVVIDAGVEVGEDTMIEAGVHLLGDTVIGADCRVRAYSVIENCRVGDGVLIRSHCVLENAVIETGALIGPHSRLREGAVIGAGAHVGNFVEVKKSRIGAGAKANHLAYVGDASVGAGSNIGAGTITCNYDGKLKHPTTIGEGAFIGSNSTLVAPVEIGAGAYIAAGSVITENVPADALGLGRSRQTNKPEWARKKRNR